MATVQPAARGFLEHTCRQTRKLDTTTALRSSSVFFSLRLKLDTTAALRSSSVFFSLRLKTGHHNGIAVFVSFLQSQTQTLTLSRDDLLELKMVITLFTVRTKSKLYANFLLELYRLHKMYQMNVIYRRIREFLRKEYSLA